MGHKLGLIIKSHVGISTLYIIHVKKTKKQGILKDNFF
jgi:hypothetical protein